MPGLKTVWSVMSADPRHGQIATLGSLLVYGLFWLDFDLSAAQVATTIATALAVQAVGDSWIGASKYSGPPSRRRFGAAGLKSALISALSLCLLLRTNDLFWAVAASTIAVGSKFVIRVRGKHVFNPTNGALVALLIVTDHAWVSPGQWGAGASFAFAMACAGMLVVNRATRSDVTLAFIASYAGLIAARSLWLGDPLTIPLHRLESGAFLLFSFFMISDPKTTPDSRIGRIVFAFAVALGAAYVQFRLFRTNGLLWSLALASPFVPLIDWIAPATRYQWPRLRSIVEFEPLRARLPRTVRTLGTHPLGTLGTPGTLGTHVRRTVMKRNVATVVLLLLGSLVAATSADAFCGFYVARAGASLFNKASQVVLVRDGDRTVITMASDFRGTLREFAVVIPVPTSITRDQIHIAEHALVAHLDAYTAPRLVEYYDRDPCARPEPPMSMRAMPSATAAMPAPPRQDRAKALGVTIEAQYTVGEYDIVILSATQSTGLETWLRESGYRIPTGASEVLGSYIRQNMRFFVAKVNLTEQTKLGFTTLRPIQVAYESPKFLLPLRLGMVNADGAQELFIYTLTRKGRVESTNYRTVKLRTDAEIPTYVKDPAEFGRMYRALFDQQVRREDMRAVFQEYAWDMSWCDPCAADPFSNDELRRLGVFWVADDGNGLPRAESRGPRPIARGGTSAPDVFVTRLHVRYDKAHFPEDLVFQETGDRTNFQGRYVLRHAFTGKTTCEAGVAYQRTLAERREREAQTLASLTGWSIDEIRRRQGVVAPPPPFDSADLAQGKPGNQPTWWERLWKK